MKTILSLSLLLSFIAIKAQNNLVVFSENGEKFFLIINGVKQNIEAETNVKVTDLIQPNYKAKIVFEDKAKGVVDQNIYFMDGGEPVKNHEFVFSVGIKKKGGYKARPVSAVAIGPQTKPDPAQTVVHYSTTEPTPSNNNVVSDGGSMNTNVNVANDGTSTNNNVQVNQTVTQTQTSSNNGENVNVGINVNGMGVNINVNDNMGNGNMSTTTSQTVTSTKTSGGTTVTKSSTSSSTNGGTTKTTSESTTTKNKTYTDGYEVGTKADNSKGCAAMSSSDFSGAKKSIESRGMDDSKLKVAKQVLDNNCMSSEQVKEVIGLFSFEQSKLDFAKYAYGRTTDKNNYYKINDAFTFESSITDLDNYIKKASAK